ncbi:MAG: nucleotidyltransferase domain-containing protein [Candidatus Contendobacter sp.]
MWALDRLRPIDKRFLMRLSQDERTTIREASLRHFGQFPLLFGSRLDDNAKGGDIDLLIPGVWTVREAVQRRLRFCADLMARLGERKIDVVIDTGDQNNPVIQHAYQTGVPL